MKRIASSDSFGALISMCSKTETGNCDVYGRDFETMFEGFDEESGQMGEKKRRLSVEQVKALEKNFEVENKLEPERKVKLAHELGLQPRQVAVWFQNRRARWKTKQLERDYGVLKGNYDALKLNFDKLHHDNQTLLNEIKELKSKLDEEDNKINISVKEEAIVFGKDEKLIKQSKSPATGTPDFAGDDEELNYESFNSTNNLESLTTGEFIFFSDLKDGFSDSDSSAIFNEDNNNNSPIVGGGKFPSENFTESPWAAAAAAGYQPQFVKIEEHNFFGEDDESCNFFSDDQAPALWYCQEQWNQII